MTERFAGFIVTLETDLRSDDAEATIAALRQIKGVISVDPVPANIGYHFALERARHELKTKLWAALEKPADG